MFGIFG